MIAAGMLLANGLFDKTVGPKAPVPALVLGGPGFFAKRPVNHSHRFDLVEFVNPRRLKIPPLGAAPALPPVHIELAVISDGHLVHIDV